MAKTTGSAMHLEEGMLWRRQMRQMIQNMMKKLSKLKNAMVHLLTATRMLTMEWAARLEQCVLWSNLLLTGATPHISSYSQRVQS
jgi:hypothetical protein